MMKTCGTEKGDIAAAHISVSQSPSVNAMIPYEDIFKYTDIFNPLSLQALHSAGKLAGLSEGKTLAELGCGKGFPAIFWASAFGVQVEGFDITQAYVDYANARAKLLNLSGKARFFCQDLKTFRPAKKYDFVSFLGVGTEMYGGQENAFNFFRSMLKPEGVIFFSEPVWTKRPVPAEILKPLRCTEEVFLTADETQKLLRRLNLQELGHFVASKEDWEIYVRAPQIGLQEIMQNPELATEAQAFMDDFKTEHSAAGGYWDDILWVLKPKA